MTELDKKLLEIANANWQTFAAMIGEDAIVAAKVCLLRQNKKSYGEISVKLSLTKERVRYACKNCGS